MLKHHYNTRPFDLAYMNFTTGSYKIERRYSPQEASFHYMIIFYQRGTKYIKIDHHEARPASECEEWIRDNYRIIKALPRGKGVEVKNPSITVRWTDEDGDLFQWEMKSVTAFGRFLKLYKRVAAALGVKS